MPYLYIFGLELLKTIVLLDSSTIEYVSLQNFIDKQKGLNLGQKGLYLGNFVLEFQIVF